MCFMATNSATLNRVWTIVFIVWRVVLYIWQISDSVTIHTNTYPIKLVLGPHMTLWAIADNGSSTQTIFKLSSLFFRHPNFINHSSNTTQILALIFHYTCGTYSSESLCLVGYTHQEDLRDPFIEWGFRMGFEGEI
jgi:hypothetical protein